jgi:hypothetical protein
MTEYIRDSKGRFVKGSKHYLDQPRDEHGNFAKKSSVKQKTAVRKADHDVIAAKVDAILSEKLLAIPEEPPSLDKSLSSDHTDELETAKAPSRRKITFNFDTDDHS